MHGWHGGRWRARRRRAAQVGRLLATDVAGTDGMGATVSRARSSRRPAASLRFDSLVVASDLNHRSRCVLRQFRPVHHYFPGDGCFSSSKREN
jgi:hypothetical protein